MRNCLACGDELFGRVDKKFCSDQCRNNYNNRKNSDESNFMRNINNILRKNRRILADLTPNNKARSTKEKLLEKGFNFNYFTNTYTTKENKIYFFCYDFGYLVLENGGLALVKKKEYV